MTLHFIHIGKTGGSAVKWTLRRAQLAYWTDDEAPSVAETPYGRIQLHHHSFTLRDVPPGDHAFFFVRDPVARFVSGFMSRLNQGLPGHHVEWKTSERTLFEAFPTPHALADALGSSDADERERAELAMRTIVHLRFMDRTAGTPRELRGQLDRIVYIGRQETLDADFAQLGRLLDLPPDLRLPAGDRRAHRQPAAAAPCALADADVARLKDWYRRDYRLLSFCELIRAWRGWGVDPAAGRLSRELRRLRGIPALVPPPPPAIRRHLPFG